jgi:hypothetical protein
MARHNDDTESVEDISPGLPDSERATRGRPSIKSSLSRAARRAKRVSPIVGFKYNCGARESFNRQSAIVNFKRLSSVKTRKTRKKHI